MTREETKHILDIIIRAYPRMKIVETKEDVDLWHECLSDLEYDLARKASINLVKETKDFPPDIATIREEYANIIAAEKKRIGAIRDQYRNAKSYYPGTIEEGYAWDEWLSRAKDEKTAMLFCSTVVQYVRECEKNDTLNDIIDFKECVKTICRDSDGKLFFKEAK